MHDLPTGTVTFLFTDIEGSTRLLRRTGERYASVLEEHQRILRAVFEQEGGREIDTQGDAFFVAFSRAKDAASAALAAQNALVAHEWPDGEQVRVRMGLHTAEPVVGKERYVGLGVHRAARICSAGNGGQVLLSAVTRELVADDLPTGAHVRDLGHHRLKDIDRPEHIFELVGDGLPADFPPLKTVSAQPDEASPFSGREAEILDAARAATEPSARRRMRPAVFILAALVGLGATATATVLLRGDSNEVTVAPDSLAVIDPSANRVIDDVRLGGESPGPISVNEEGLWVLNLNTQTLARVDPRTRELLSTQGIGGIPSNMAAAGDDVWILDSCNSNANPALRRYEHGSPLNIEEITLPPASGAGEMVQKVGCGLAASPASAWAGLTAPTSIVQVTVDPSLNIAKSNAPILLRGQPNAIGLGEGAVWVVDYPDNVVYRVDAENGKVETTIPVGEGPIAIALGLGAVWVANQNDGSVSRIDPRTNSVVKAISVGRLPNAVAVGAGAVWAANAGDGTISRIDTETNSISRTISVGHRPQGIAFANNLIWVTVRS
jgi:YVTN family beta-propeller protein